MYPLDYDPNRDPYPATTTCQAFIILIGTDEIKSDARLMATWGNYVNRTIENKGKLVLNINLDDLMTEQKDTFIKSTAKAPISLEVKFKVPPERDAQYCEAPIKIVNIAQ